MLFLKNKIMKLFNNKIWGFSLVELIVVISILIILWTILSCLLMVTQ